MSALDTQVGGNHYKSMAIQPMEFSMANELDACQHSIVKYVVRFRDKNGIADLEKAKHVIDMLIEFETKKQNAVKGLVVVPIKSFSRGMVQRVARPAATMFFAR